jgi:hypothetical protein
MEPHFANNDKGMFYKYLDNSKIYFEFGSGGSTYQASIRNNIKKIYSVESDFEWHTKLKTMIKKDNISFIFNEMGVKPNTWGNPGPNSSAIQRKSYSDHIRKVENDIDFILIDGRFRVACCLKCFEAIPECLIAFDDFLNRKAYHCVLDYYDIIEKTSANTMVILKKKDCLPPPLSLIEKYELIAD